MTTATTISTMQREPTLLGQTVVLIGGSAGIGLEPPAARAEGAEVIPTGRDPDRLRHAAHELGALSSAAFDAADPDRLARFFQDLPTPIDHVMVTAGRPYYARLADLDFARARREVDEHLWLMLHLAREAAQKVRPAWHSAVHERHRRPAPRRRPRSPGGTDRRTAGAHRQPGARAGPRCGSTSSPPASSTHRCRQRCSAISSRNGATSSAPRSRSTVS